MTNHLQNILFLVSSVVSQGRSVFQDSKNVRDLSSTDLFPCSAACGRPNIELHRFLVPSPSAARLGAETDEGGGKGVAADDNGGDNACKICFATFSDIDDFAVDGEVHTGAVDGIRMEKAFVGRLLSTVGGAAVLRFLLGEICTFVTQSQIKLL